MRLELWADLKSRGSGQEMLTPGYKGRAVGQVRWWMRCASQVWSIRRQKLELELMMLELELEL